MKTIKLFEDLLDDKAQDTILGPGYVDVYSAYVDSRHYRLSDILCFHDPIRYSNIAGICDALRELSIDEFAISCSDNLIYILSEFQDLGYKIDRVETLKVFSLIHGDISTEVVILKNVDI